MFKVVKLMQVADEMSSNLFSEIDGARDRGFGFENCLSVGGVGHGR